MLQKILTPSLEAGLARERRAKSTRKVPMVFPCNIKTFDVNQPEHPAG
jgi:hypothetical protein